MTMADVNKLLDVIESLVDKVDVNDPKEVNELEAFSARLESLSMDLKDRTESKQ
jgi:hypothetical protein